MTESTALEEKPEELAARCAATPEGRRGKGLVMACDSLRTARDEAAGAVLAKNGPKLAADCEATPEAMRTGGLRYGCISYGVLLVSELGSAIAGDDAAWAVLCPGGGDDILADRDATVSEACSNAGREREERAVKPEPVAPPVDPATLDRLCKTDQREKLLSACLDHDSKIRDARVKLLETDDALFARDCARALRAKPRPVAASRDVLSDIADSVDDGSDVCRTADDFRENAKVEAAAKAKGLKCWPGFGRERPNCVSPADYAAEEARTAAWQAEQASRTEMLDHDSSLSIAARARAAAIIASAKASGTYPKRPPGDEE